VCYCRKFLQDFIDSSTAREHTRITHEMYGCLDMPESVSDLRRDAA
jgi:hypothetical protein